jgi:hypothetical protein
VADSLGSTRVGSSFLGRMISDQESAWVFSIRLIAEIAFRTSPSLLLDSMPNKIFQAFIFFVRDHAASALVDEVS